MELNTYQRLAEKTSRFYPEGYSDNRLLMATLGLTGEAGEVADYVKKVLFHNHSMNNSQLSKEIGDVLWYLAEICSVLNLTLDEVAEANLLKLQERYGKAFSSEASINRKD